MNMQNNSIDPISNATIPDAPKTTHAMSVNDYNLDEVIYDVGNIKDMLSAIRYLMSDLDFGVGEKRNYPLQRISSLVEVTAAISERSFDLIVSNFSEIKGQIERRHA